MVVSRPPRPGRHDAALRLGFDASRAGSHGAPSVRAGRRLRRRYGRSDVPRSAGPAGGAARGRRGRADGPGTRVVALHHHPVNRTRVGGVRGGGGAAGGAGVGGAGRCAAGAGGRRRSPTRCWPVPCAPPRRRAGCSARGAPRRCRRWPGCTCSRRPTSSASPSWDARGRGRRAGAARAAGRPGHGRRRRRPRPCSSPSSTASCWRWSRSRRRTGWWRGRRPGWRRSASGLDPRGLAVPEVGHLRAARGVPGGGAGFRGRNARRPGRVDPALLRPVGGGRARGAVDRRRPRQNDGRRSSGEDRRPPTRLLGIQACTTCRDGGLGVQRPGTQAHDDMPPAACCAWSARSSRTKP